MTYYSDQVAASRRAIADALSGKRLRDSIRQLQERSRVTDGLKSLQARGALTSKKKIGKRTVAGGQLTGPFTEIENTRTFYSTEREFRSADGLFLISYFNVEKITMRDGGGSIVEFIYDDHEAT